nr:glycosyltransferase [Alcanivorax sp. 1008]
MLGRPLILDMRDAWSQWAITPYASILHYHFTKRLEFKAIELASQVLVTSEQTRLDLLKTHPSVDERKISTITNSFEEDYSSVEASRNGIRCDAFKIGYVGSFYYEPYQRKMIFSPWWKKKIHHIFQYSPKKEDWLYRSPEFFLRAVSDLRIISPSAYEKLEVEFVGAIPSWLPSMIARYDVGDKVRLLGPVSRVTSLEFQKGCDALLITSSKVVDGRDYSIAGKTFEYVAMGLPIIAFVCDGAQKDILNRTGLAKICDPENRDEAVEGLRQIIEGEFVLRPNLDEIRKLSIADCVKQLASVIREVEIKP